MIKKIVNLIFEAFHLKHVKHEWVRLAGVQFPDSVAEHSLNAAQIWYILAKMEWADANKVATMLIWHDIWETRIWDMHKIWSRYFENKKDVEKRVIADQFSDFDFAQDLLSDLDEYNTRSTLEWNIAKDADYLEMAFQAKIYVEQWYSAAQDWIDNVWWALKTGAAKQVRAQMIKQQSTDRWRVEKMMKIPTS